LLDVGGVEPTEADPPEPLGFVEEVVVVFADVEVFTLVEVEAAGVLAEANIAEFSEPPDSTTVVVIVWEPPLA
jgi:hypothetical protein